MTLVIVTLGLIAITSLCFIYGAIGLAKYASRLSIGHALAVILFPPYAFYFSFYQLRAEEKAKPTAFWLGGLLSTVLLVAIFWLPLSQAAGGNLDALAAPEEATQQEAYVPKETKAAPAPAPTPTPAPAATPAVPGAPGTPGTPTAPGTPTTGTPAAPAAGTPAVPAPAATPTPAAKPATPPAN